jgi:hypothetical protein
MTRGCTRTRGYRRANSATQLQWVVAPAPVEQASRRQQEGASANRHQLSASGVRGAQRSENLRRRFGRVVSPSRHYHKVGGLDSGQLLADIDQEAGRRAERTEPLTTQHEAVPGTASVRRQIRAEYFSGDGQVKGHRAFVCQHGNLSHAVSVGGIGAHESFPISVVGSEGALDVG